MKANVYNENGEVIKEIDLASQIFEIEMNEDLLHQAVRTMLSNRRKPIADTKGRGEVRGGGKKPWKQKGTGRARQGSIRSPLWKGGGVTFGPLKERNFSLKINKKMKDKALKMALSLRAKENKIFVLEKDLNFENNKTKEAQKFLTNFFKDQPKPKLLIVDSFQNEETAKALNNLPKTKWLKIENLNILDLINYESLMISQKSIEKLTKNLNK
mgnify:CR=1 FL=1